MPAAQRTQIVNNIRKNSLGPRAAGFGAVGGAAGAAAAAGYSRAPMTSSPPGMGQSAPLPRVDERRQASGSYAGPPAGMTPRPQHQQSGPRPGGAPPPDPRRYPSGGPGPASSPRPAGTPPLRRPGGPGSQPPPQQPQAQPQQQQQQQAPPPLARPPTKGPQTFAEMGIATQKVEDDSNCVIM